MVASSVSEANGGWRGNRGLWTAMVGGESAVEESEPSLSLRLGIGGADECAGEKPVEFTRAQLSELYRQSLAYTNLAAPLPVSPHLLLPLRKSEAGFSRSPVNVALQKDRSTCFVLQAPDYMNRMRPEPERCRRTDGKKWRCRKNVVPDQKYCELHINRGRQHPRKAPEVSKIASLSETTTSSKTKDRDLGQPNADFALGVRLSTGVSSDVSSKNMVFRNVRDCCGTSVTTVSSSGSSRRSISSHGRCQARNYVDYRQNFPRSRVGINNDVIRRNVFPGLGFSPRSILQVIGSTNPSWPKGKGEPMFERWRCRRTDGKKWRCSRDVLPDQKYCERHIHRGSKKLPQARTFGASAVNHGPITASIEAHSSNPANPSTSLSISTPAASQRDERRGSGSSSAESDTTLSDTTTAAYV